METEFRLKIVNLRESLVQGDITRIARLANVSLMTVHKMFKVHEHDELKPAMKLALDATIKFVKDKKIESENEIKKILE